MKHIGFKHIGTLLVPLLLSASAGACPLCNTETGKQVRSGLFNEHFGMYLAMVLLPFPIFIGIAALLYFGPPKRMFFVFSYRKKQRLLYK